MSTIEQVIEGCRRGDADMQRELYRRYSPLYYPVCRRYAVDDMTAQEMLVESFLTIFNHIGGYRGEGAIEGWMHTIVVRTALLINMRERREKYQVVEIDSSADAVVGDSTIESMDLRQALIDAMRRLTDDERTIMNLVAVEGYKMTEVAELLKRPLSTVKSQYYRAQSKMQKLLRRRLGERYLKIIDL